MLIDLCRKRKRAGDKYIYIYIFFFFKDIFKFCTLPQKGKTHIHTYAGIYIHTYAGIYIPMLVCTGARTYTQ